MSRSRVGGSVSRFLAPVTRFRSLRVEFILPRVNFGLKKSFLGLCDPIFLGSRGKMYFMFGILTVG